MTIANSEIYEMIMQLPVEKSKQAVSYVELLYANEKFEPNQETIDAMNEVKRGGLRKFNSIEELMADLNADD